MIRFADLTKDNFYEVIKLWDTLDETEKRAVAPNAISIAQAYVNQDRAWPQAIYDDETIVGFLMLALHDDDIPEVDQPSYYLWRFMIGKDFQGKHYGKEVVQLLIDKCKKDSIQYLYVTCTMHSDMPYQFYIKNGFVDTLEMDDDEQILKMKIDQSI